MSGAPATTSLVPRWLFAHRRAAVWIVGSALVVAAAAAIALGYAAHPGAQPFEPQDPVVFIGSAAVIAAYGFVFAVLVSRVGENVVGWIFGIVALVLAISNLMWAYVTYATETIPPQLPGVELALLLGISLIPWWTSPLIVLIVCFPDGRPISRAWAWLAIAACLVSIVGSLAIIFGSGPLPAFMAASPLALPGPSGEVLAASGRIIIAVLVAMAIAAVWSLGIRYRAADDTGRLQLKWLVYAGGVLVVCGLIFWIWAGSAYAPGSGASTAVWLVLCCGAIVVPIAASVAILRYRLYDIETIIGRTLVYGGLTAILAGLYTAAIRLFNSLFSTVTGERSDSRAGPHDPRPGHDLHAHQGVAGTAGGGPPRHHLGPRVRRGRPSRCRQTTRPWTASPNVPPRSSFDASPRLRVPPHGRPSQHTQPGRATLE